MYITVGVMHENETDNGLMSVV